MNIYQKRALGSRTGSTFSRSQITDHSVAHDATEGANQPGARQAVTFGCWRVELAAICNGARAGMTGVDTSYW